MTISWCVKIVCIEIINGDFKIKIFEQQLHPTSASALNVVLNPNYWGVYKQVTAPSSKHSSVSKFSEISKFFFNLFLFIFKKKSIKPWNDTLYCSRTDGCLRCRPATRRYGITSDYVLHNAVTGWENDENAFPQWANRNPLGAMQYAHQNAGGVARWAQQHPSQAMQFAHQHPLAVSQWANAHPNEAYQFAHGHPNEVSQWANRNPNAVASWGQMHPNEFGQLGRAHPNEFNMFEQNHPNEFRQTGYSRQRNGGWNGRQWIGNRVNSYLL